MRAIIVLLVMLSVPAMAEPLPNGGVSATDVAAALRASGYPADITSDRFGDPMIRSSTGKEVFEVNFLQCGSQLRCAAIQFVAPFRHKVASAATVAAWNRGRRFGRAFLDGSGVSWVSMDVRTGRDMTTEALQASIRRWLMVVNAFEVFAGR
jgi:hypothetical protein